MKFNSSILLISSGSIRLNFINNIDFTKIFPIILYTKEISSSSLTWLWCFWLKKKKVFLCAAIREKLFYLKAKIIWKINYEVLWYDLSIIKQIMSQTASVELYSLASNFLNYWTIRETNHANWHGTIFIKLVFEIFYF